MNSKRAISRTTVVYNLADLTIYTLFEFYFFLEVNYILQRFLEFISGNSTNLNNTCISKERVFEATDSELFSLWICPVSRDTFEKKLKSLYF